MKSSPGTVLELSASAARALHLAAQGLLVAPAEDRHARRCARRDPAHALLQIDTIHVVARSPYLVLFSRVGDYRPQWLDELLGRRRDLRSAGRTKPASRPIEDYALHRRHALETQASTGRSSARGAPVARTGRRWLALLAHVREHGAGQDVGLRAAEPRSATGGWWGWKREKSWLEALFAARRADDRAARELPARLRSARARAPEMRVGDACRRRPAPIAARARRSARARARRGAGALDRRLFPHPAAQQGRRISTRYVAERRAVARGGGGMEGPRLCPSPTRRAGATGARVADSSATHTTLLSPFDPVVWDRERAQELFGFDYRLECYTPAAQAAIRLFRVADSAPRRAGRPTGREGAPLRRRVRGQGAVPRAGRALSTRRWRPTWPMRSLVAPNGTALRA